MVSNDIQNEHNDQIIVAPLTSEEVETIRFFEVFNEEIMRQINKALKLVLTLE